MTTNKQRREAERRRLQRQLQRRKQRAERRKRTNLIVSIVGVVVVVGVVIGLIVATSGDDPKPAARSSTSAPSTPPSSSAAPAYPCTWTKSAAPASRPVKEPSTTTPSRKGVVTADVATNRGSMVFALNRANAPCAVESFVSLAQQKFYDKTPCHRLTASQTLHVLQCGDPSGTGTGGAGYQYGEEVKGSEKYARGVLAVANAGTPGSSGSQFFIVYGTTQLPAQYTVLGTVRSGLNVVDTIVKGGIVAGQGGPTDGKPKLPVTLTKVTVAK